MSSDAAETTDKPLVAPELEDKVKALHLLAATHHHLGSGSYKLAAVDQVRQCLEFLATLHGQLLTEALAHPHADKIEKLVEMKKQREEQVHVKA